MKALSTTYPTLILLLLFFVNSVVHAQVNNDALEEYSIEPFRASDIYYMEKQIEIVNDIAGFNLGRKVQGDFSDLSLLQDIIDRELIDKEDRRSLQALGAVLGELLKQELGLSWRVYRDALDQAQTQRSRALCHGDNTPCLFPTTMLSRRMEVGLKPNVKEIYNKAVAIIRPPKNPEEPKDFVPKTVLPYECCVDATK
ncbi:MAG: DUF3806 domain-containing protein [Cellvibrionaceae bacterium]